MIEAKIKKWKSKQEQTEYYGDYCCGRIHKIEAKQSHYIPVLKTSHEICLIQKFIVSLPWTYIQLFNCNLFTIR